MVKLFLFLDSGILLELLANFTRVIPRVLGAFFIAIIGYIIAKIIASSLKKLLKKINIDKIGDKLNAIEIVSKSNIEIKISSLISKVVYYFLLLFFMVAAADALAMPAVSNLVSGIFNLVPHLIVAGIILIVGVLFADALRSIAQTSLDSLGIPSARMISNLIFYFLFINIIILALSQAKVNTAFLSQNIHLLIGGIVLAFAIGYGLASKATMSNFLASYYIKDKFQIGDTITIEGIKGKVIEIDKSSLILAAESGNKVIFPLSKVSDSNIEIHI